MDTGLTKSIISSPPTKVGFVFVGATDDFGWTYVQNQGRTYLESVMGGNVVTRFTNGADR